MNRRIFVLLAILTIAIGSLVLVARSIVKNSVSESKKSSVESLVESSVEPVVFQTLPTVPTTTPIQTPTILKAVYFCGYGTFGFEDHLFPEYTIKRNLTQTIIDTEPPTSNDLLLFGMHGPCSVDALTFPGQTLFFSGEPVNPDYTTRPRSYQMSVTSNYSNNTRGMQLYPISRIFFMNPYAPEQRQSILDPTKKPTSTKEHFLTYTSRNCQPFRDAALLAIATTIGPVHQGGNCPKQQNPAITKVNQGLRDGFFHNYKQYHSYRFCLVMENSNVPAYVTEKILLAFLGGCIPIYWGTLDVYNIFNAQSFIYYDIQQPQAALDKIQFLESNKTAYQQVMDTPILANGTTTIQDFFSLNDNMGGGHLKQKLRHIMGLEP